MLLRCYAVTYYAVTMFVRVVLHGHFRIRCYDVTLLPCYNVCMRRFTRSFSYLMLRGYDVTLLRCYAVTMLRCYDVCMSRFTRSFSYSLLRCYAVTMLRCLHETFNTVIFVSAVTMLRCYTLPIYFNLVASVCRYTFLLSHSAMTILI